MKKTLLLICTLTVLSVGAQNIIYVNQNATGANNGTSWADAYTYIANVSNFGNSSTQIWVAAGTYTPTDSFAGLNRDYPFILAAKMYGGFNGTETQLSQRDWVANPTIISGDIGTLGDNTDNSQTVVQITGSTNHPVVIDGFTISDGYADGTDAGRTRYGGGIFVNNAFSDVTIKNCIIKDNMAHYYGGIYGSFAHLGQSKNITIENTRFTNNYARGSAAFGFNTQNGTLNITMINCLIDNNSTGSFGGAPGYSFPGGRLVESGGGSYLNGLLLNCTFTKNTNTTTQADNVKSVLGIEGSDNFTEIYNTIFYDNNVNTTNTSIGYGSNSANTPSVGVYNTISEDILGNLSYVGTLNNTQVDPLFTDPSANDFTLQNTSPAINTGITSGVISTLIPTTDLAGNPRLNGNIDLGCYENQTALAVNEQIIKNNLTVYPNPASSQLTINCDGISFEKILIIDITGKTVKTIVSASNTIDVSNLIKGVYFVQVQTKEGLFNSKFMKE